MMNFLERLDLNSRQKKLALAAGAAVTVLSAIYFVRRICCSSSSSSVDHRNDFTDDNPPWFLSELQHRGDSMPRAIVDLDAFDRNVQKAIDGVCKHGKRKMRIATKSIRCVDLTLRFIRAVRKFDDSCYAGLMCFSAQEVLQLAMHKHAAEFKHILLAYPIANRADIKTLVDAANIAAEQRVRIACMIDCKGHVDLFAEIDPKSTVALWIDVDMAWKPLGLDSLYVGVRRSPLGDVKSVVDLALYSASLAKQRRLEGMMGYEAEIAGIPDSVERSSLPAFARRFVKSYAQRAIVSRRAEILGALKQNKFRPFEFVNGGGTGSIHFTATDSAVTEITVGSGALCGTQFDGYDSYASQFKPALFFALQVTRVPVASGNIVTCHGGGWIASGDPGWYRLPKIAWPPRAKYLEFEGAGEVQTPLDVSECSEDNKPRIGSLVLFRPCKSGETVGEIFERIDLVSRSNEGAAVCAVERVFTYRGLRWACWN